MDDNSTNEYLTAKLDPNLLSTRFSVQTNWHVITGAPCSGKSTLIDQLADSGVRTAPEGARQYFEQEMARGRTIEEIRDDAVPLVYGILNMMLVIERGLDPKEVICLDRGYPDCLAFLRQMRLDPNEYLRDCFHHRYASVFILDRFTIQLDGVRVEDEADAIYLDKQHDRDYTSLGYRVVRVPVLPPQDRLTFVLEKIAELYSKEMSKYDQFKQYSHQNNR